jgi:predicted transcriptional regulator
MEQKLYLYINLNIEVMGALELREELHKYVEIGDRAFLKALYKTAKSYIEQKKMDKMIAEGEEDIKAGRLHGQDEVQKMIESWTKE